MPFFFIIPLLALPLLLGLGRKQKPQGPPAGTMPAVDPLAPCRDISQIQDPRVAVYMQKLDEWRREFGTMFPHGLSMRCWVEYREEVRRITSQNPTGDNTAALSDARLRYEVCRDRARTAEERWRELQNLRIAIIRDCVNRVQGSAQGG
jgi:hypothetical protein